MEGVDITPFHPNSDKEACLDAALDIHGKNEEQINAELTPLLQRISSHGVNGIILVNSEHNCWLSVGNMNDSKPDFHNVHAIFHTKRKSHNDVVGAKFGTLVHESFVKEVLFLWEGKITELTNKEKGIMLNYQSRRGVTTSSPRGVLYNHEIWIYFEHNYDVNLLKSCVSGKWTDKGSFDFLGSQVRNAPISDLTEAAMKLSYALGVTFVVDDGNCFLGRGAEGCVFKVRHPERIQILAMKIVLHGNIQSEFELLEGASISAPNLIVKVIFQPKTVTLASHKQAGAFLLEDVGIPVSSSSSLAVMHLLVSIHIQGIIHGDPRLANVIRIGNILKWIDLRAFRGGQAATPDFKSNDLKICIKSFFLPSKSAAIELKFIEIENLLNSYGKIPTINAALQIFDHVSSTLCSGSIFG